MLDDKRSVEFVENFTGQWLQARDVVNVPVNDFSVFLREHPNPSMSAARRIFVRIRQIPEAQRTPEQVAEMAAARAEYISFVRSPRSRFTGSLKRAMRDETQMFFDHILREDRSLLELIDSDYTFVNEALAKHYGITAETIVGGKMRKVDLPAGSPRGGILTQGTVLTVISNPTPPRR
ncbi:MAG: DUF1592 domain-containing protein [Candidatus Synoicihabitans palmerolidicus]|nr:DUF1592 domain-containing protein [Candidatus Synoicihabitans palmerolidicus]